MGKYRQNTIRALCLFKGASVSPSSPMTEARFEDCVLALFVCLVAFVIIRNAIGQRQVLWWYVRRFLCFFCSFIGISYAAKLFGLRGWWVHYIALALPFSFFFTIAPRRSRWIPLKTRQGVIERFEKRTGVRYDAQVHHIDHKVPFAKGGGHTMDNLRVVPASINRRKGGRLPNLRDWIRMWTGKE